jgi:hypothetical protein
MIYEFVKSPHFVRLDNFDGHQEASRHCGSVVEKTVVLLYKFVDKNGHVMTMPRILWTVNKSDMIPHSALKSSVVVDNVFVRRQSWTNCICLQC